MGAETEHAIPNVWQGWKWFVVYA